MRGVKRSSKSVWKRLLVFVFLFSLLIILGNSTRKVYNKNIEAEKALVRMEQEIKELKDRQTELKDSQERLKTQEGIEYEIRKKFSVAREGEHVAIIVDNQSTSTESVETNSSWQKIKSFFSNIFN
jgi:cell division protein FtsB